MIDRIFPFFDFLYLLQLEEYDSRRYLNLLPRFFFRRKIQVRQKLVLTSRAKTTLALSVTLTSLGSIPLLFFTIPAIPVWVLLANILLDPIYLKIKSDIQNRAAKKFKEVFKGKVIAIAGSYGKTTTKNYIYELIRYNYKTKMIPGNINTPTGIAAWVLKNLDSATEYLIVEMDTYFIGEIKKSCTITPPDIAILTNVGDQHLERLGTRKNLKIALYEVFDYAKAGALKITGKKSNLDYALEVAKRLEIPADIIMDTIKRLSKPERRGNITHIHDYETIDESYNISFTTATLGLENALKTSRKHRKKLIVITGGIPELGFENREANQKYGELLNKSDAQILILKTVLHKQVLKGITREVYLADSMKHAWDIIEEKFDPKKHIVLMQPELGDNYY